MHVTSGRVDMHISDTAGISHTALSICTCSGHSPKVSLLQRRGRKSTSTHMAVGRSHVCHHCHITMMPYKRSSQFLRQIVITLCSQNVVVKL